MSPSSYNLEIGLQHQLSVVVARRLADPGSADIAAKSCCKTMFKSCSPKRASDQKGPDSNGAA